jgi:hypothetical protein
MGNDVVLILVVTALALGFISHLIRLQLGSLGVPSRRIVALQLELWASFALILLLFILAGSLIGTVAQEQVFIGELQGWWLRIRGLPAPQQGLLLGMLLTALAILWHFMWVLSDTRRQYEAAATDDETEHTP